jgi:hypothetical protein
MVLFLGGNSNITDSLTGKEVVLQSNLENIKETKHSQLGLSH